jgi:hypothetical protein
MKMKNKIIVFFLAFFMFFGVVNRLKAQQGLQNKLEAKKQEIENLKKELLNTRLNLNEKQEKEFWKVYDEYTKQKLMMRRKINQTRKSSLSLASTDEQLNKSIDKMLDLRQEELTLEKEYKVNFLKIINVRQLAELYRTEHEFIKQN